METDTSEPINEQSLITPEEESKLDKVSAASFELLASRAPDIAARVLRGETLVYLCITFPRGQMICKHRPAGEQTFTELFRVVVNAPSSVN